MKKRHWLAILCAALVLAVVLPFTMRTASAEDETSGQCGDDLYWEFDESTGTLTITGSGVMWDFETSPWDEWRESILTVRLPDGLTTIGKRAFEKCNVLTSVLIPDSVTSIGQWAFCWCYQLGNLTIPDGVSFIGWYAFNRCAFTEITIPASVMLIEDGAFSGCESLTAIKVDESNPNYKDVDGVLFSKDGTELINYPSGKQNSAYTIPNGTESIHYDACDRNKYINTVIFPDSVLTIGSAAFSECSNLQFISLGSNVSAINGWAFSYAGFAAVNIPNSVTFIDSTAFASCRNLTSITVDPDNPNYTSVDGVLFNKDQTMLVTCPGGIKRQYSIPDGVLTIGEDAFYGHTLQSVFIPISVRNINNSAFHLSRNLKDILYEGSETDREDLLTIEAGNSFLLNADWHYNSVRPEDIDENQCGYSLYWSFDESTGSLTITGSGAMWDFNWEYESPWYSIRDSIKTVVLPNGLTKIGSEAFLGCWQLTAVTIPNGMTSIGADAFFECQYLASVFIPESVTEIGYAAFGHCSSLTEITISDTNSSFISVDGVLYTADRTRIVAYPAGKTDKSYIIPDGTVDITEAFRGCSNLKIVSIPDSVTSIGDCAFIFCSGLTSINLPVSVTTIEWGAFAECSALTDVFYGGTGAQRAEIEIKEQNDQLLNAEWHYNSTGPTEIADNQCGNDLYWSFDESTGTLTISGSGAMWNYERETSPWYDVRQSITSVVLPEGLTTIGEYAFGSTAIMSIVLPDSLQRIGSYAFRSCRQLTAIHIPQNVSYIGSYAFTACNCLTAITVSGENEHFCSVDGVLFTADRKTLVGYPTGNQRTAYEIPEGTVYIADDAFYNCSNLITVLCPEGLKRIGRSAFRNTGLTSVCLPVSVTTIDRNAFYNCRSLTEVYYAGSEDDRAQINIDNDYDGNEPLLNATWHYNGYGPDVEPTASGQCGENLFWSFYEYNGTLTITGSGAMWDYQWGESPWYDIRERITSVGLSSGLTRIGNNAFDNCNKLTSVAIPDSVTKIGDDAFRRCHNLTSISFPDSLREIGDGAFDATNLTAVTIPNGVTSIGADAFRECKHLASVFIPESITEIGYAAFGGYNSLTEITISDANNSFVNVDGVLFTADRTRIVAYPAGKTEKSYIIPDGTVDITEAFRGCANLKIVTIPDSVTTIGSYAFIFCSRLASINLPVSVTTIESGAFEGCSALTDVYYAGTEAQKAEIEIGEWSNDPLLNATWHYALEITTQPKSVTVASGKTAKFTVAASSVDVMYQWYYSKDNGKEWIEWSGKTSDTATVKASATTNGYLYRCKIIKDGCIVTSESAKLTVSGVKPKIVVQPKAATVKTGKSNTFKVVAAGSGLKYQWYYSKDNGTKWTKMSGKTTASLKVKGSATTNGYLYRCKITNTKGSVTSKSVKLTVSGVKPKIVVQPKAVSVKSGKTAKFSVVAAGTGLKYQWYYSKNAGKTWTKMSGKTAATLSVKGSKTNNGYLYRCVVKNTKGSVTSKNAKLTVK